MTSSIAPPTRRARLDYACDRLDVFFKSSIAYAYQMGQRPQTLCGIADFLVGLAAYLLDHDARSLEMISDPDQPWAACR